MDIIQVISAALNGPNGLKVPAVYGWYNDKLNKTHITFLEFDNLENEYFDDSENAEEHYIQVDLWTFNASDKKIIKDIKRLLKQSRFLYEDGADLLEPQTDGRTLYHYATRWLYVEEIKNN